MFCLRQKLPFEHVQLWMEMRLLTERKKKNQTIVEIIFSNTNIYQFGFDSPQVNRYLISTIKNLAFEFLCELSTNLGLSILGNYEIL